MYWSIGVFSPIKTAVIPAASASSAGLLPSARYRSRVSDYDAGVQTADVNPQLKRVRARNSEQLAGEQLPLYLPALLLVDSLLYML